MQSGGKISRIFESHFRKEKDLKVTKVFAKIFRVITVPPFLALLLLLYLYFGTEGYFKNVTELLLVGFCIVILPILSYPICFAVPKLRAGGRKAERTMAFIMTGVGYTLLMIPTFLCGFSEKLTVICVTYFLSALFLILFNKGLKLKASGHACGVFGPILIFLYVGGSVLLIPCLAVLGVTVWSSLKLGRHTPRELFLGGLCSAVALITSIVLIYLI